ncbi:NACHT, LRR and PYD domains-containing protein 12-like isoform X2 [Heterodontus francisci]|uniref:NACHT, LRR and PYD domains-containing protein 12-like isoform X2 n=1 Tax=Heterodontus francisci TaxID=7792 RepID=UPI00355B7491
MEDGDADNTLVVKLGQVLDQLKERQFLAVYDYYKPELINVVQDSVYEVIQQLKQKGVFTEQEAQDMSELRTKGQKNGAEECVASVRERGPGSMKVLWETLCQPHISQLENSVLAGILTELHSDGLEMLEVITLDMDGHKISRDLKACQAELKCWVTRRTERFDEHNVPWGSRKRRSFKLDERYTELIVVPTHRWAQSRDNEMVAIANVHESLAVQAAAGVASRPIRMDHLFRKSYNPLGRTPRVVVVCGVPGIGKTTMVQKLLHDWAAGRMHRRFSFVFHFQFRELNLLQEPCSLLGLIAAKHPFLDVSLTKILQYPEQVLFLFDGLDESREALDFTRHCQDAEEIHPFPVIVASLMNQDLLKGCSVLLTSRPTALETLDRDHVQKYTEILGFFPEQRRRYFEKFYNQRVEAQRVYHHVRGNGILYNLCFNPSYCWILCSALEGYFARRSERHCPPPRTITQLFAVFVSNLLANHARDTPNKTRAVRRIGRMAFDGVQRRVLVFYKPDLQRHGLGASQFLSGFLMEFLEREAGSTKLAFSFLHLTVQEFLAALYFVLQCDLKELGQALEAVDLCQDGRYEIFARFLSGLSKPANSHLLDRLLGGLPRKPCRVISDWLMNRTQATVERGDKRSLLQALHCLFEAQQSGQVQRTLGHSATIDLSGLHLNPVDCSAVAYTLDSLNAVQRLDVGYSIAQLEGLDRLIPQLKKCKEIGLNNNNLRDERVQDICAELRNPGSIVQTLQLRNNGLTSTSGVNLAFGIKGSLTLTHLDLDDNSLKDSGLSHLCQVLKEPNCRIQTLKLESNDLTSGCCKELASALDQNWTVKELYLSFNSLEDTGLESLLEKMCSSHCQLHTLRLSGTKLTERSGSALSRAFRANPTLRCLDLSSNKLMDTGTQQIFQALTQTDSQMEKLWLQSISLTQESCKELAFFLRATCTLTGLYLKNNKIGDEGMKLLSAGLRESQCQLQTLRLDETDLKDDGVQELITALSAKRSITELTLPYNSIGDASVDALSQFIVNSPQLQEIRLRENMFSPEGIKRLKNLGRPGLVVSVGD